jgi:endonuclease/exonuclease/phosphatase family metal-dependent hydrolase
LARENSAKLILEAVDFEASSSSCPVFLLGDLNSPATETAYKLLSSHMHDLRDTASTHYGHYNTFTGFDGKKSDLSRIDHIFGSRVGWKGGVYSVVENLFEDGIYLSDHRPVIADVVVGKELSPGKPLET